ncbi:ABC transporter substrate-binding protein [Bacteroidota bacterium]
MNHILVSILWIALVNSLPGLNHSRFNLDQSFIANQSAALKNEISGLHKPDSIKIGLIIEKEDELGIMAIRGAEMAVEEANINDGYNGNPFHIIIRDCEGPWGRTSKEVANLVYEDEVTVIMASLDGRNAHLTEQVTTKTHIPLVSTRATEATLTQAFIPWYFRSVPSDKQQIQVLYKEIFLNRGFRRVGIIKSENYEDQQTAYEFNKYIAAQGLPSIKTTIIQYTDDNFENDLQQFNDSEIEAIIIFMGRTFSEELIQTTRKKGIKTMIYTDLSFTSNRPDSEKIRFISPVGWYEKQGDDFKKQYYNRYGQQPGLAAAYAYDGMNLIMRAITIAGPEKEAIKEELSRIVYCDGITGCINFDKNGNKQELPVVMEIRNGKPEIIE